MTSSLLRLAACLLISSVAQAESYQGAQSLLDRLQPTTPNEQSASDAKGLKPQLEAFKQETSKLDPAVAAKRWLSLFETFASLPARADDEERIDLAAVL